MKMHIGVAVFAAALVVGASASAQVDPSQIQPNIGGPQNPNGPQMNPPGGLQNGQQTPSSMRDTLGAPGQTGQEMSDKNFIQTAAAGGIGEVKLGTLAVQKGGPEVKVFGQKVVDDRTSINKEFAAVADSLGVMLPKKMAKDDQAEYEKLNGLSGDAFDKEFILYMTKEHRQDLHDFRMEASVAANQELSAEIVKAAGVIREHLNELTKLAEAKGVTLPPRPPRPAPPAGQ